MVAVLVEAMNPSRVRLGPVFSNSWWRARDRPHRSHMMSSDPPDLRNSGSYLLLSAKAGAGEKNRAPSVERLSQPSRATESRPIVIPTPTYCGLHLAAPAISR